MPEAMMNKQRADQRSIWGTDALIALVITTLSLMSYQHPLDALRRVATSQIRVVDALLGIIFVFAWHYCMCVLNLYEGDEGLGRRLLAALKGVTIMTIPVVIYLLSRHRESFNVRTVLVMMLALFGYESIRLLSGAYLLSRPMSRDPRRAIILGSGRRASKAWRSIRTRYHTSVKVLGFVDDRELSEMAPDIAKRYIGRVDELSEIMLREVVDMVLIAMPIQSCYGLMQRAVHIAESVGVQVVCLTDNYLTRRSSDDSNVSMFQDIVPQQANYLLRLRAKRLLDICGAVIGLVCLTPVYLCIALGVRLTSEGPVFFQQKRYGYRRRIFTMFKFRSMVHNAEQMLSELEHVNEADGPTFKMKMDPRVTKFGRFLRVTSLDELPQLWNVLLGDMSLVGPRPMSVRDVSLFNEATLMRRFSVKPGMTGLWQVSGRSDIGFDQWMVMDHKYIDGWSLALDVKILMRTVSAVLKRSGAM
jgi:exopolysaccharide biosynthesis polyprenyl glycosylphosphotransferase